MIAMSSRDAGVCVREGKKRSRELGASSRQAGDYELGVEY